MNKKIRLLLVLPLLAFCQGAWAESGQPNLLIILADDLGYNDVGFNGSTEIPTPHIDSIARQGVLFKQGYVSFPVCGPSRAGLMTGRYQDRFGFTTNPTIDPTCEIAGLPFEEENMAEVLNKANYKSAIIGKWHLGSHPKQHPLSRGFDYFYGFLSGGHDYFPENLTLNDLSEVKEKWQWYKTKLLENHQRIETDDYLTDELSDAAIRYMDKKTQSGEPFFVYLAYNAPHSPMQATEKYLSRFSHIKDKKRRTYAAMISALDDGVGRILESLEVSGQLDNTLIFFLSDNGGPENHNASDNGELRGQKGTVFEGGIRVPFAMMWKKNVPAGMVYQHPVISLDILATIAGINHIEIDKGHPLDGTNLIPYLTGEKKDPPHEILFWRKRETPNVMAVRSGDYKLLNNQSGSSEQQMYNISQDISEEIDIKNKFPEKSAALHRRWQEWNSQLKDREFPTLITDVWWK